MSNLERTSLMSSFTNFNISLNTPRLKILSMKFFFSVFFLPMKGTVEFALIITQFWNTSSSASKTSRMYLLVSAILDLVFSMSFFHTLHLAGPNVRSITKYSSPLLDEMSSNSKRTTAPLPIFLLIMNCLGSSLIVLPKIAK